MSRTSVIEFICCGLVHPSLLVQWRARALVTTVCAATAGAAPTVRWCTRRGLRHTIAASVAAGPRMLVLLAHHSRRDDRAIARLVDYVAGGGALLALHGTTASFKGDERYASMLGARFAGHGPIRRASLIRDTAVDTSVPAQIVVRDEPYEHEFVKEIDVWYRWDSGGPAVWTRSVGRGVVGCVVPGHRLRTLASRDLQTVVAAMIRVLLRMSDI